MGDLSDKNDSRPSLDTEAISGDEETGSPYEEVKLDLSMLSSEVLNPPTIPKTLNNDTIDQVIAALTNVPDVNVKVEPGTSKRAPSPIKRSGGRTSAGIGGGGDSEARQRSSRRRQKSSQADTLTS